MEAILKSMTATEANVILASNSPRRRQLLQIIQPRFVIASSKNIIEEYPDDIPAEKVPEFLSNLKCQAYKSELAPRDIIITADTVVINQGQILGKPQNTAEAIEMLSSLMGHTHIVVTGVTLMSEKSTITFSEKTEVKFGQLTEREIADYVRYFSPFDKAGAYGIQEWIGCVGIESINGCFYNVMGLPLHALYKRLKNHPY